MAKHILVVDDQKAVADATVNAINKLGRGEFIAEAVYGGQACLDRLVREPAIHLVLLDLDMPEINGADVIRNLIKRSPLPALRVLVTTGWGPDWVDHWDLSDVANSPAYRELICQKTSDKTDDVLELMDQIGEILQEFPKGPGGAGA